MTGGFMLRKCVFENNTGNPVQLYCNKGVLDHCVIRNNSGDAIRFVNGGNESPIASFNLICDTIIENNAGRPIYSSSTDFKSSWSNDVRNCLFRNNTTTGSDILNLRLYTVKAHAPKIGYVFRFENNTVVGNRAGNGTTRRRTTWAPAATIRLRITRLTAVCRSTSASAVRASSATSPTSARSSTRPRA